MAREVSRIRAGGVDAATAALRRRSAVYRHALELLGNPATQVVELRGSGPSPAATGRVIWHEHAGGYLVVDNLPPLPPGKAYEVWTLGGPAPRPAGVFKVDASGQGRRSSSRRGTPGQGLRREHRAGGRRAEPTGPIVLASR